VVEANTFRNFLDKYWSNQNVLLILTPTSLELEVYQFVCESDVKMRAKRTTCACQNTLDLLDWMICRTVTGLMAILQLPAVAALQRFELRVRKR